MSDIPWATAWYGQTQSIWLTPSPQTFLDINDLQKPIQALHLTRVTLDEPLLIPFTRASMGEQNWSQVLLATQELMLQNPQAKAFIEGKGPLRLNLPVRTADGVATTLPLHYMQMVKGTGLTEQILLTAREHSPKGE